MVYSGDGKQGREVSAPLKGKGMIVGVDLGILVIIVSIISNKGAIFR